MALVLVISCSDSGKEDPGETVDKQVLLSLINEARTSGCQCGSDFFPAVGSVTWSDTLEKAAKIHSQDMDNKKFFSHEGSDGSTIIERVTRLGYSYSFVGENIAQGYLTEQQVVEGWLASPGHCRNIMNGHFREMGITRKGDYWTQVLGTRRSP